MFEVGFGDCFLLTIPTPQGARRVLVDCGSIAAGELRIDAAVKRIVEEVTVDGRPRIDVVIATHRHRDHVSGFADAAWDAVEVGEVWLPWTEDPSDGQALGIRAHQQQLATSLRAFALRAAGFAPDAPPQEATAIEAGVAGKGRAAATTAPQRVALVHELAANAIANEAAMAMLLHGFSGRPRRRFLPDPASPRSFETSVLPGVVVHVLGPSRDPSVLADLDPPAGQAYLRMSEVRDGSGDVASPFGAGWETTLTPEERTELEELRRFDPAREELLAASLDRALNGTSLMLVLEVGGARLLLPGDAQWGSWEAALRDPRWRELLGRTSFYKVGHHGSENATPVEFVKEVAPAGFWAMVPVTPHGKWPLIPKPALLEDLRRRTSKLARADDDASAPRPAFHVEPGVCVDAEIPM